LTKPWELRTGPKAGTPSLNANPSLTEKIRGEKGEKREGGRESGRRKEKIYVPVPTHCFIIMYNSNDV
jgi:hypothetical protein